MLGHPWVALVVKAIARAVRDQYVPDVESLSTYVKQVVGRQRAPFARLQLAGSFELLVQIPLVLGEPAPVLPRTGCVVDQAQRSPLAEIFGQQTAGFLRVSNMSLRSPFADLGAYADVAMRRVNVTGFEPA